VEVEQALGPHNGMWKIKHKEREDSAKLTKILSVLCAFFVSIVLKSQTFRATFFLFEWGNPTKLIHLCFKSIE
jgi:hypothetical protein